MPFSLPQTASSMQLRGAGLLAVALAAATMLAACSPDNRAEQPQAPLAQMDVQAEAANASLKKPASFAAQDKAASSRTRMVKEEAVAAPAAAPVAVSPTGGAAAAPARRFLAVRHNMQVESPAAELAGLWESVKAACERLDCYVEGSALQRETSHAAASAYLTMRVNPRDFAMLTAALGGNAKVLNHQTATDDKTSQVIDVAAQIKNRSEYRDSLRELLREKNVKRSLQDLMEIRDTMSQVQAEIDAANMQRELLEIDTAKQLVQMQFQPTRVIVSGTYSPWQQTWQNSWDTMARSLQTMVIAAAGLLPWLLMLAVLAVPVWLWQGRRNRRAQAASAATAVDGDGRGADTRL